MEYLKELEELKQSTFAEIESSVKVLKLIKIYSELFANGGNIPAGCAKCRLEYWQKLNTNEAIEMAMILDEVKNRTCVPAWSGLKFVHKQARHYSDRLITDKEALRMLELGILKETDFKVLPDGYLKKDIQIQKSEIKTDVAKTKRGRKNAANKQ